MAAINSMAANSLRCVAIAYRSYELGKIPKDEEHLTQWALPEDELVLLGIVGIKVSTKTPSFLLYCSVLDFFSIIFVGMLIPGMWELFISFMLNLSILQCASFQNMTICESCKIGYNFLFPYILSSSRLGVGSVRFGWFLHRTELFGVDFVCNRHRPKVLT